MVRGLRALLAATALTGVAVGAAAFEVWLDDGAITAAFAGRTIDGHYVNGTTFTESYHDGGRLDYREPGRELKGHWSVINGTFCTIYDASPTGGCYRVTQVSANCYEFYFLARDEAEAVKPEPGRPRWTARGWHKDRPATCNEKPSV